MTASALRPIAAEREQLVTPATVIGVTSLSGYKFLPSRLASKRNISARVEEIQIENEQELSLGTQTAARLLL